MDNPVELPEKLFFKIGEVARIVDVEPYVLRYWESEFAIVKPRKSRGGQRLYRRADVDALLRIKKLLRDEGFTIAGARKRLAQERAAARSGVPVADPKKPPDTPANVAQSSQNQHLLDEIERLKMECKAAVDARSQAAQELGVREDDLYQIRKEIVAALALLGDDLS